MVSNISFGSTYKVTSKQNGFDRFWDFQKYANNKEMKDGVQISFKDKFAHRAKEYNAQYIMVAPDSMDDEIETFCAVFGIKYKKYNTEALMKPESILKRIDFHPKGMQEVKVDVDKLYEIIQNQSHNIDHCESDYRKYYSEKVDFMLKSADEIPATTLGISPMGSDVKKTLEYINRFGADNLNKHQLFIGFDQRTDDPDHCVFFALKDMGIKEIPMYVNKDTYEIANALGILK